MAVSGFKWLFLSLICTVLLAGKKPELHPLHVSVIEINHNAPDKTLEISCKIFTDDFEAVLQKNYKTKVDLIHPVNKAIMDTLVKKYILSHLALKVDGKTVHLNYLGFENEGEAAYAYIEVENVASVKKIDVALNIMHDLFDDQINIIHTIVGGNRKSGKVDFPATTTTFMF